MTHPDREYQTIAEVFDRVVRDAGPDGAKLEHSRDETVRIVTTEARYLLPDEATRDRAAISQEITTTRASRSGRALHYFQEVEEALDNATLWGDLDPVLDLALRTGHHDGIDKTLRMWTIDDWLAKLEASAQNVADAIAADAELRPIVNRIISRMAARGAHTVGDLA